MTPWLRKNSLIQGLLLFPAIWLIGCTSNSTGEAPNSGFNEDQTPVKYSGPPPNAQDWKRHPQIVEDREIYFDVVEKVKRNIYKKSIKKFSFCEPGQDTTRILYTDNQGLPQKYFREGGSEDSAAKFNYFYDLKGRLRFIFVDFGAANETKMEIRVFFDAEGKKIWEDHQLMSGPGYPFPKELPPGDMVWNPKKEFESKNPCPETSKKS